ncbi:MAG TPA: carbohydrate-binding family 9-like protein [Capsulimonadaceae bacterium]|jgi:hypothetical protein
MHTHASTRLLSSARPTIQTVALLILAIFVLPTVSADAPSSMPLPHLAVPMATSVPAVDAPLTDPAWSTAARIDGLSLCVGPQATGVKPIPTQVQLAWTPNYLFVRFVCRGGDLYAPHGVTHDTPHHAGDVAELFLDPVGDAREFIEIQINPVGGVSDTLHLLTTDAISGTDGVLLDAVISRDMWDLLEWDLRGLRSVSFPIIDGDRAVGWVASLAIPAAPTLKRLGATQWRAGLTFRANFLRYDQLLNDHGTRNAICMNWSPVVWGRPHRSPAAMGIVTLIDKSSAP